MTLTQAIVIDMDGVLIDSEELHAFSVLQGEEQ
jgi:beta-phosphoglucomutase-like phosphatase (HAD superfamily)